MKKILLYLSIVTLVFSLSGNYLPKAYAKKRVVLHYYYSPFCPVCKRVSPQVMQLKKDFNLRVIKYALFNKRTAQRDYRMMRKLISRLKRIHRKKKGKPFVMKDRKANRYYPDKTIPYYLKRISPRKELRREMPVPIIIIGDTVVLGFDKPLVLRLLREAGN
ncbi:hypothetical protein ACFL20_07480 [Spirochaetota bacterium]